MDSLASLDSIHVLSKTTFTQKLGRIIDDSVYMREFVRIQGQMQHARIKNEKDSVAFFQYEINYMKEEIDSVTKLISLADSTHRYGLILGCAYYLSKSQKKKMDSTYLFLDSTSTLRFTEYMDSSLSRTLKTMN